MSWGCMAASPRKTFGQNLSKFGENLEKFGKNLEKFGRNLGKSDKYLGNLIRFGQKQNLASPKL